MRNGMRTDQSAHRRTSVHQHDQVLVEMVVVSLQNLSLNREDLDVEIRYVQSNEQEEQGEQDEAEWKLPKRRGINETPARRPSDSFSHCYHLKWEVKPLVQLSAINMLDYIDLLTGKMREASSMKPIIRVVQPNPIRGTSCWKSIVKIIAPGSSDQPDHF